MTRGTSYQSGPTDGREISLSDDDLIDLQSKVLDGLEASRPDLFAAADRDPALKDSATVSQRRAWLAIYGPHSGVQV